MNLYALEIKRILSSRFTRVILIFLVVLAFVMGYVPVTFVHYSATNQNEQIVEISGPEAVAKRKVAQAAYSGTVTPEMLKAVLISYQTTVQQYGEPTDAEFPLAVYNEKILPISPLLHLLREAYADPSTGMAPDLTTLSPELLDNFYSQSHQHLADLMAMEQADYPQIQQLASEMYKDVAMPFTFYPGYNVDALDYHTLYLLIIILAFAVIAAPIFASEYQTKADDILRSTKHGHSRLAVTKIAATLTIFVVAFMICMTIFSVVSNSLFGWECRGTSIQALFSISCLPGLTLGQTQQWMSLSGFLTILATISCSLFMSTKCRSTAMAIILGIVLCLLPTILYMLVDGNIASWIRCLLPSGGVGLLNSFLYALIDLDFLHIGQIGVWTPYVLLGAAIVEIPVFLGLTVHSYCVHTNK